MQSSMKIPCDLLDRSANCSSRLHTVRSQKLMIANAASHRILREKRGSISNQAVTKPLVHAKHIMDRSTSEQCRSEATDPPSTHPQVYLALGSNLGDRVAMIEAACRSMTDRGIRVLRTSHLYETEPKYVEDQDKFLNSVCQVGSQASRIAVE